MSSYFFSKISMVLWVIAALLNEGQGADNPILPSQDRYVVIFDTTTPEPSRKSEYQTAVRSFTDSLQKAGIPATNIHVYSAISAPATRKAMEDALAPKSWKSVSPAELQVYITANGLSNGVKDMLVPAEVSIDDLHETGDTRLISFEEIQKRIANCGARRILLVMNFQSVKTVTRSSDTGSALQNVKLQRYRGLRSNEYFDEEEEEISEDAGAGLSSKNFQFLRIVTRDQDIRGYRINDFYQTFRSAIEGYADISGNHDGMIQAEELAYYLRDNTEMAIEISRNGNAEYVLCKANKKVQIPADLFEELSRTFTRDEFRQERDSAAQRAAALRNQEGNNP